MTAHTSRSDQNNTKYCGHFVPQQRPRAAHALRSDQFILHPIRVCSLPWEWCLAVGLPCRSIGTFWQLIPFYIFLLFLIFQCVQSNKKWKIKYLLYVAWQIHAQPISTHVTGGMSESVPSCGHGERRPTLAWAEFLNWKRCSKILKLLPTSHWNF